MVIIPKPFSANVNNTKGSNEKIWWYIDQNSNMQGPFASEDMDTWFQAGYFAEDLQIRYGERGAMQTLKEYLHNPSNFPSFRKTSKSDFFKHQDFKLPQNDQGRRFSERTGIVQHEPGTDGKPEETKSTKGWMITRRDEGKDNSLDLRRESKNSSKSKYSLMTSTSAHPDSAEKSKDKKNKKKNKKRKIIRTIALQTNSDEVTVAEVKFVKIKKTTDAATQTDDLPYEVMVELGLENKSPASSSINSNEMKTPSKNNSTSTGTPTMERRIISTSGPSNSNDYAKKRESFLSRIQPSPQAMSVDEDDEEDESSSISEDEDEEEKSEEVIIPPPQPAKVEVKTSSKRNSKEIEAEGTGMVRGIAAGGPAPAQNQRCIPTFNNSNKGGNSSYSKKK